MSLILTAAGLERISYGLRLCDKCVAKLEEDELAFQYGSHFDSVEDRPWPSEAYTNLFLDAAKKTVKMLEGSGVPRGQVDPKVTLDRVRILRAKMTKDSTVGTGFSAHIRQVNFREETPKAAECHVYACKMMGYPILENGLQEEANAYGVSAFSLQDSFLGEGLVKMLNASLADLEKS
jgi:hypothetical protein